MNIHWNDSKTPPRKLKKQVRFTPSTTDPNNQELDPEITPFIPTDADLYLPPTPDPNPTKGVNDTGLKKKKSFFNRFRLTNHPDRNSPLNANRPPSPADSIASNQSWHHHDSYYPTYEPIYTSPTTSPSPSTYPLTLAEIQAQQHSDRIGHSVIVHYPLLPSFAEFNEGKKGAGSGSGWQSVSNGRYGIDGWTGYGWEGERLPNTDGLTFAAPMPKVDPLPPKEDESKKKKKKKKKGGGGGGGGDDKEDDEGGDGDDGDGGDDE